MFCTGSICLILTRKTSFLQNYQTNSSKKKKQLISLNSTVKYKNKIKKGNTVYTRFQYKYKKICFLMKFQFGSFQDLVQLILQCTSSLDFDNIYMIRQQSKIWNKIIKIYLSKGFQMKAVELFDELKLHMSYMFQNTEYLQLEPTQIKHLQSIEQVIKKKYVSLEQTKEQANKIKEIIDQIYQLLQKKQTQSNSIFSWFSSDPETQIKDCLEQLKLYDVDVYILINILRDQENKTKFNVKLMLERNACKFEYWFAVWIIIKNKFFGQIQIDKSQFIVELQNKIQHIIPTQNAYIQINCDMLFQLIGKKISGLEILDVVNYMLIKSLCKHNMKLSINYIQRFRNKFIQKEMYLYFIIKCYTRLADQKQFLDNDFMIFHINLFKDMNLDKNIPKNLISQFWGKIFYLLSEFLILTKGDQQDIVYFYDISNTILTKIECQYYLKSKKRFQI